MHLLRSARWLLLALVVTLIPASSHAQILISVHFGPPALPVYVQPPCPQPDLMWVPGNWHYNELTGGYYWVPGAWVPAPYPGALWTPGYWGWNNGMYYFHEGYWGRHIGYYGGVNYGFGYGGNGYAGGEWRGGHFAYNTAVINVNNTVIHTTYVDRTIVERTTIVNPGHVAYSGGPGGIHHDPTPEERIAEHEQHVAPTSFQQQHIKTASSDKTSYATNNGGHPHNLVATRPLAEEKHTPPPESHAAPMERPMPASHPAPASHPMPESRPMPQSHPAPASHPMPESRPMPASHPAPASHPMPESRPMPQSHPAPASRPAPASHPAPPAGSKPEPKPKK
jgi:hypothetical protein